MWTWWGTGHPVHRGRASRMGRMRRLVGSGGAQVRQQYGEPGPPARAPALHGARRDLEDRGGLRDGVALHVDQHQRRLLVGGQRRRGRRAPGRAARRRRRGPPGRLGRPVSGRRARRRGRRAPRGRRAAGSAARTLRRRSRSRQALTTIRCSQVVTAASPRKESARRKAEISASWRASAASSGLPVVRSATAQSRSRCRRNSSPNASGSPARWASTRAASLVLPTDPPTPPTSSVPASRPDRDVGDLPAVATASRGQPGQPDQQVAGRRGRVERDGALLGRRLLAADLVELVDASPVPRSRRPERRTPRRRWARP